MLTQLLLNRPTFFFMSSFQFSELICMRMSLEVVTTNLPVPFLFTRML